MKYSSFLQPYRIFPCHKQVFPFEAHDILDPDRSPLNFRMTICLKNFTCYDPKRKHVLSGIQKHLFQLLEALWIIRRREHLYFTGQIRVWK